MNPGEKVMMNIEQVGRRISILRREKQLSQEQLAEQLHVSAQAVSKWETGRSLPETSTLPLLSAVLGHSIDSILLPQELTVLSAVYTDGNEQIDVTHWINQLITGNKLTLSLSDQFFRDYCTPTGLSCCSLNMGHPPEFIQLLRSRGSSCRLMYIHKAILWAKAN